jgi:hypothetical protein
MLLQSLLAIAIMLLLAGALLTNALVSAKVAMHEAATRNVSIALARGTDDFTRWAANFVYTNRAGAQWPTNVQTTAPESICDGRAATMQTVQRTACTLFETTTYQVTGSTTGTDPDGNGANAGQSTAENLQTLLDEQRISAEVTSTITNASGVVIGTGTRELTARVFDAPPYAIVTGTRDVSSVIGSIHAVEGDTGGVNTTQSNNYQPATPNPASPWLYQDTSIKVKMTCQNSTVNADQSDPGADNHPPGNNDKPWGVQDTHGAFEAPCRPTYGVLRVPSDASIPTDADYDVGTLASPKPWTNRSATSQNSWTE